MDADREHQKKKGRTQKIDWGDVEESGSKSERKQVRARNRRNWKATLAVAGSVAEEAAKGTNLTRIQKGKRIKRKIGKVRRNAVEREKATRGGQKREVHPKESACHFGDPSLESTYTSD